MIFEGEYKYGKRDKGKERKYNFYGNLIMEIVYIDGIKSGKVYEYDNTGILIFEGLYKDEKRNGLGKEYGWNNELLFEGEYLDGKRNGSGKDYNIKDEVIFEGKYLDDEMFMGKGRDYDNFGRAFEVEYFYGKKLKNVVYQNGKLLTKEEFMCEEKERYEYEYGDEGNLIFEGKFINGKKMDQEKNMIIMAI